MGRGIVGGRTGWMGGWGRSLEFWGGLGLKGRACWSESGSGIGSGVWRCVTEKRGCFGGLG